MTPAPSRPQVDEALRLVTEIHAQVTRGSLFRGYRALPVALMGVVALGAAALEALWLTPRDAQAHARYWIGVALLCASFAVIDIGLRRVVLRARSTHVTVGQVVPSLVVGVVLAVVLWDRAELLPGLWTMVFGLGVLASCPYLPRAVVGVALFYVAAGIAMTLATRAGAAPSPWAMGLTYGVGQLVSAAALRCAPRPGAAR